MSVRRRWFLQLDAKGRRIRVGEKLANRRQQTFKCLEQPNNTEPYPFHPSVPPSSHALFRQSIHPSVHTAPSTVRPAVRPSAHRPRVQGLRSHFSSSCLFSFYIFEISVCMCVSVCVCVCASPSVCQFTCPIVHPCSYTHAHTHGRLPLSVVEERKVGWP